MTSQSCWRGCAKGSLLLLAGLGVLLAGGCAPSTAPSQDRPAAFWPPYPDEPHIQYLVSFSRASDVEPAQGELEKLIYGKEKKEDITLQLPYGVDMWHGRIYVCDQHLPGVMIFDLKKQQALVLGPGDADALQKPNDIAIADDGFKYVTDMQKQKIFVYDADDRFVRTFFDNQIRPVSLAVFHDQLFVCDVVVGKRARVVVLDRHSGQMLRSFGTVGSSPGQFTFPLGIAVDQQGNVYVADVLTSRLQKFDPQGKLLDYFGQNTDTVGGLVKPKMIAVDKDQIIYVVGAAAQNVQMFHREGSLKLLTYFGGAGSFLGSMEQPVGICVHEGDLDLFARAIHPAFEAQRLILVTNQSNPGKVSVYALGHLRAGKTVEDIRQSKGLVNESTTNKPQPMTGLPTTMPENTALPAPATAPGPATRN